MTTRRVTPVVERSAQRNTGSSARRGKATVNVAAPTSLAEGGPVNMHNGPAGVIWDITYACPLRCMHCYSESGRRPSRQPSHGELLRIAEALASLRAQEVAIAGGEPLLVRGLFEIIERFSRVGSPVVLYTSGWTVDAALAEELLRTVHGVAVSLDGATAEVHDRIRGRMFSFERAVRALELLDEASRALKARGETPGVFGVEVAVMRSNHHQVEAFCSDIAPRFPEMRHLVFGVTIPAGLASREGFVDHELLDDEQVRRLCDPGTLTFLKALAPTGLRVAVEDNRREMMHPDSVAKGEALPVMHVTPDGDVHAMPIYEGRVGNVLDESPHVLWERALARRSDPFVVETLAPVVTMRDWAQAVRRIDRHFGSAEDLARIGRRSAFRL
ncbi:radical SAM protein [Streptomyces sp. NPDC001404]|uniref:radical SAM protein n=1 Tax=Streptomyces sp. NPDC001404 TaxID=3364571 RepID=UPI003681686C